MANDAFALSPISARAAEPSEADYAAICDAFMETARGRWFLTEYAQRNRNADTRLVLDAVARLEATLAQQKQAAVAAPASALADTLAAALPSVVNDAKVRALAALALDDAEQAQSAIRRGARIIRDVAWTLRECGADVRICDLLDAQVAAIDAGCDRQGAPAARHETVIGIFDDLALRLGALARGDAMPPATAAATTTPAAASMHAPVAEPVTEPVAEATPASLDEAAPTDAADATGDAPPTETASAFVVVDGSDDVAWTEPVGEPAEPTDIDARAIVDMHDAQSDGLDAADVQDTDAQGDALQADDMQAGDSHIGAILVDDGQVETVAVDTLRVDAPMIDAPAIDAPVIDAPVADDTPIGAVHLDAVHVADAPATMAAAAPEAGGASGETRAPAQTLGATLLRNGMVDGVASDRPRADPLAPLRKLSQAEKIALFT